MTHTPATPGGSPGLPPPEGPPRRPEELTTTQVYAAATAVLLDSPYRGDAHRRQCDTLLGSGVDTLLVSDYHSWNALAFTINPDQACANPDEQRRLLEVGEAIIGLTFRGPGGKQRDVHYTCAWIDADSLRADSPIGWLRHPEHDETHSLAHAFNQRHALRTYEADLSGRDIPAVAEPLSPEQRRELDAIDALYAADSPPSAFLRAMVNWPADQPAIIRSEGNNNTLVTNPHDDMRLFGVHQALMSIIRQQR